MTASAHPIQSYLPSVYSSDVLAQLLCGSLDELLAPVFVMLDSFPAYLDPRTTPEDLLDWLAAWIGVALDPGLDPSRRRESVVASIGTLPGRGTRATIAQTLRMAFDVPIEVVDSGGTAWSMTPNSTPPGSPDALLTIRVRGAGAVDIPRLERLVKEMKPAHLPHAIEGV